MNLLKTYRHAFTAVMFVMAVCSVHAQELNCKVEINTSSLEGTNKSVFETLENSMTEYLNQNKWTNSVYSPIEKIDCNMFLTVKEYSDDRIRGELQLQLVRPVFNSTYTTTLLNMRDTKVEFDYREGEPLIFSDTEWNGNLTGLLDFYAYLILGVDSDSFSPKGGQQYFDKAAAVVQKAQSSGEPGWRIFEDNRNRSAVLNSLTDGNTGMVRDLCYLYHRKGLDEMSTAPDKGRGAITSALGLIREIYRNSPMSAALSIFRDAKLDELVNIYSEASQTEREEVCDLLEEVYPADTERLEKIRKPE